MLIGVERLFSYYLLPSSVNTSSVQSGSHSGIYHFALLQGALISKKYLLGRQQVRKKKRKKNNCHTFTIVFVIVLMNYGKMSGKSILIDSKRMIRGKNKKKNQKRLSIRTLKPPIVRFIRANYAADFVQRWAPIVSTI